MSRIDTPPVEQPPHAAGAGRTLREVAAAHGVSAEGAEAMAAIDATMLRIRRGVVRRDFGRAVLHDLDAGLELVHMDALCVVAPHELDCAAEPPGEVTVGQVAERLSIDPSRASRVVSELVDRGYLRRVASQADARRIGLELTERGRDLLGAFGARKWQAFVRTLANWSDDELQTFAQLIERYSTWTDEVIRKL